VREIERGLLITEEILRHLVTVLEDRGPVDGDLAPAAAPRSIDEDDDEGADPVAAAAPRADTGEEAAPDAGDDADDAEADDTSEGTSDDTSDDTSEDTSDDTSDDTSEDEPDEPAEAEPASGERTGG
jgi:hypothetical protein